MNQKMIIEEVGICDSYEVGNWTEYYPDIKLGYKIPDYKGKYSDISFYIKDEDKIYGYFLSYSIVNLKHNDIVPIYSRKLVLYDFAIYAKAYVKLGKLLMDYAIKYAKDNGYQAIEIKVIDDYHTFLSFIKKNYQVKEFNNNYYIMIDCDIKESQKHLQIYETDVITIDDLYYLNELNFAVSKYSIDYQLTEIERISIDRRTGIIKFPSNVKERKDKVHLNNHTRDLIYLIYQMYQNQKIDKLNIDYSLDNPYLFEAYCNSIVYVNKDIPTLKKEKSYVINMINKGVDYINCYIINYDMNDRSFSYYDTQIKCSDLLINRGEKR